MSLQCVFARRCRTQSNLTELAGWALARLRYIAEGYVALTSCRGRLEAEGDGFKIKLHRAFRAKD